LRDKYDRLPDEGFDLDVAHCALAKCGDGHLLLSARIQVRGVRSDFLIVVAEALDLTSRHSDPGSNGCDITRHEQRVIGAAIQRSIDRFGFAAESNNPRRSAEILRAQTPKIDQSGIVWFVAIEKDQRATSGGKERLGFRSG